MSALPFQLGDRLGGGAFSEVFRVAGQPAVVKLARAQAVEDAAAPDPEFAARGVIFGTGSLGRWRVSPRELLRNEVAQLRKVKHPAFIKVLSDGEADGRAYAVMELIEGRTWRSTLGQSDGPKLKHVQALIEALAQTHSSGELGWHGDVKPDNLYLDGQGAVHITDPCSGLTQTDAQGNVSAMVGTELYNPWFAPSDLFALGVLLIEVLSGKHCLVEAARPGAASRVLSSSLQNALGASQATGHGRLFRRVATMPLPSELSPKVSAPFERLALRCMGLERQGASLSVAPAFASVVELSEALASVW